MIKNRFKYIYGPVFSWRMGLSLGIDPISTGKKICNFDCLYCQLGRTVKFYTQREDFVSVEDILQEIKMLPPTDIDYFTFSGRGEPTLAKNLGAMIQAVRLETGGKIAVITNAASLDDRGVREDLKLADYVLAKLDASDEESFNAVDIPAEKILFSQIIRGIKLFKDEFKGKLALQVMFIRQNQKYAKAMADLARGLDPDEIQINTPLRPGGAAPLTEPELLEIKAFFKGLPVTTVFEAERRQVQPFEERGTILRHGNYKKDVKPK